MRQKFQYYLFVVAIVSITSFLTSCDNDRENQLRQIHQALYEVYLPADSKVMNPEQLEIRHQYQEALWKYIQNTPAILDLLKPLLGEKLKNFTQGEDSLQENWPSIFEAGFAQSSLNTRTQFLLALRRSGSNEIRKYAFDLRKTYIGLSYFGNPLTNQIAQIKTYPITSDNPPPPNNIPFLFPQESKLIYNSEEQVITHQDGEIDYLIIGSGPAGSLIAHELARTHSAAKIVVVDAGSFVIPGSFVTESYSPLMEMQNRRNNVQGGIAIRNGRAIGGGSVVNVDLAFSPRLTSIQRMLDAWVENGDVDQTLFHENGSTKDWKKVDTAYQWITQKIGTRKVGKDEINTNQFLLYNHANNYGAIPDTYSLNAVKPENKPGEIVKKSAVEVFLKPALLNENNEFLGSLSIVPDAKVSHVTFDQSGQKALSAVITFQTTLNDPCLAQGIICVIEDPNEFNVSAGETATISAKNIILSAGTLGSAEILLRTDQKAKQFENPNIGKGIVIHPSMGIPAQFATEINLLEGLPASVWAVSDPVESGYFYEAMAADPAFAALIHPGYGQQILDAVKNFKYFGGFGIMLVDTPHPDNRVALNPKTDEVEVYYQISEPDKKRMKLGIKNAIKILFAAGAKKIFLPTSEPILSSNAEYIPLTRVDQIDDAISKFFLVENENFISCAHMQGSNKMGKDASSSVVSTNFHVWNVAKKSEIENFYVVDSSIFPTSIGANPMQSIYTFAKLFVDRLK